MIHVPSRAVAGNCYSCTCEDRRIWSVVCSHRNTAGVRRGAKMMPGGGDLRSRCRILARSASWQCGCPRRSILHVLAEGARPLDAEHNGQPCTKEALERLSQWVAVHAVQLDEHVQPDDGHADAMRGWFSSPVQYSGVAMCLPQPMAKHALSVRKCRRFCMFGFRLAKNLHRVTGQILAFGAIDVERASEGECPCASPRGPKAT